MPIPDAVQGYRLEAETFTGVGQPGNFRAQAATLGSGGAVVKLATGGQGAISVDLAAAGVPAGQFLIRVVFVDETDGVSQATLTLDGATVGAWQFDGTAGQQLEAGKPTGTGQQRGNWREILFDTPLTVTALSRLTLAATQNGNESARIDHIELIPILPPNEAPTAITLQAATVVENIAGATIGTLAATDPNPGDTAIFSTTDARFEIVGDVLRLRAGVSLDAEQSNTVAVTATDSGGLSVSRTFTLAVGNVNEAPVFTAGATAVTVEDGGLLVADYDAADPDVGATLQFGIAGGADAARFTINAAGQLSFVTAPSAALPTDANADGVYLVTVAVTDGSLTTTRDVAVDVVPELPIRIDFRPATGAAVAGWQTDAGDGFDAQRGYGWITEASLLDGTPGTVAAAPNAFAGAVTRRKGEFDPLLATYIAFQPKNAPAFAWEHALDEGWYRVTVAIGDVSGANTGTQVLNVEGAEFMTPWSPTSAFRSSLVTGIVHVTDGRLTLDAIGGNATRIQSIEIEALPDLTPLDANPAPADYSRLLAPVALSQGGAATPLVQASGIDPEASFAVDLTIVRSGQGVATESLTPSTVRLVETLSGLVIEGEANTSGGGDVIVFTPDSPLRDNTGYTLSIIGATDTGGVPLLPITASFVTGSAEVAPIAPFGFTAVATGVTPGGYTTLLISPDGTTLYAAGIDGSVTRWSIDPLTGALTNEQALLDPALLDRPIIGLVFDPTNPDVLWATSNGPFAGGGAADFSSKLVRITLGDGPGFDATVDDYLVGLPRSSRDHLSNSLAFHDDGGGLKLYLIQGSNSAMGAPDNAWANRPERLLSAAVLEIDTTRDVSAGPINVQTQDPNVVLPDGAGAQPSYYDPFAPDAPVKLYATGIRNAYDLVWHSNGGLYIATNGSAAGGNVPDDPATAINEALTGVGTQNDYLFRVQEGFYYGHPNPLRGEYVLNGGNPTAGNDVGEVGEYPVGVTPPGDYGGIAYDFSRNRSPNGSIEYQGLGFDGTLAGRLLIAEYSGGNDILVLELDAAGAVVGTTRLADAFGQTLVFNDPLDLVEHGPSGRIYVASLGDGSITLLNPTDPIALPGTVPLRVEAEDLPGVGSDGWRVVSMSSASGGRVAAAASPGNGPLSLSLDALTPGYYQVRVVYVDETDGVSSASVTVGGVLAGAWLFDGIAGQQREPDKIPGLDKEPGNLRSILLPTAVEVGPGDTLEINVIDDAGETGRIDFLELLQVEPPPVW